MNNEHDNPADDAFSDTANSTDEPDFSEVTDEDDPAAAEDSAEALRNELAEAEKKALRYQADLDNFRRRTRREAEELARYAAMPLVTEMLDAVDNLNRAIEASATTSQGSALDEGVRMVAAQMQQTLATHGCTPIEAIGQPFDPNLHQAVQMIPSDEVPENHVVHELRSGFRYHERVLRPAQVMVSTGPAS